MTELKNKIIEALKSIDLNKLNIYELKTVSEIAETVDKLDKKDYAEVLAETMKSASNYSGFGSVNLPKTIGDFKEG